MNHNPFSTEDKRRLKELAEMSPAEYGRCREDLAAELGMPLRFLDQEHHERRKLAKNDGDDDFLADPEPWPEPIDGADLLDEIEDAANKHLVLPDGGARSSRSGRFSLIAMIASTFHPCSCSRARRPNAGKLPASIC